MLELLEYYVIILLYKIINKNMTEELENKIRSIIDEIYSDVQQSLPSDMDFQSVMVEMVLDRLSWNEYKNKEKVITKFIRSII